MSLPLVCPSCQSALVWDRAATCVGCGAEYPIREGIPLLVAAGADTQDLWEEAESSLSRMLRDDPQLERALLGGPPAELAAADAFLRALVLEERGSGDEVDAAFVRLYAPEALACMTSQMASLCERLGSESGLVVDLASGRGALLDRLRHAVRGTLVATDISPRVLRRARRKGVAAVACDVRQLPFADGSVDCVTSFAGLNNVSQPGALLRELRRVAKRLLAVHLVYEPGTANDRKLEELGLAPIAYLDSLEEELQAAHWDSVVATSCSTTIHPTPTGVLLEGAVIDALPVEPVHGTWLVIDAT